MRSLIPIFITVVAIILAFLLLAITKEKAYHCSDFRTRSQAQKYLAAYPDLDRDHDGVACESLPQ